MHLNTKAQRGFKLTGTPVSQAEEQQFGFRSPTLAGTFPSPKSRFPRNAEQQTEKTFCLSRLVNAVSASPFLKI